MEAGRAEDQPLISTSNCACFNHKLDCLLQGAVNEDYDTDLGLFKAA